MGRYKNICRNSQQLGLRRACFPAAKGKEDAETTGDLKKKCRVCGEWVAAKVFRRHLKERHTEGSRRFPCSKCSYAAKRMPDLKRHFDAKHSKPGVVEEYVPERVEASYTPSPIAVSGGMEICTEPTLPEAAVAPVSNFPDVAMSLAKLETDGGQLPCTPFQRVGASVRKAIHSALQEEDTRSDLKKLLEEEGFLLLTPEELRQEKLDARKRGREEAEEQKPVESNPKDSVAASWSEAVAQPVPGRWAPIPRQLTLADKLVAFDLRMRVLDLPEGTPIPKPKRKTTSRKPKLSQTSASSSVGTPETSATSTSASTSAVSTPASTPSEEITINIGPSPSGDKSDPIAID